MFDQQSLRPACVYAQSGQSLCWSIEYSINIKLLTEHHLEFFSLTGGCQGSSESTHVKMPHCWKSHVTAQIYFSVFTEYEFEAFGEDAETQFLEGDWEDKVLDKYILFRRFKMELHNNPVCIATY